MHRQLLTLRTRAKKGAARQRIGCKFRLPANPPWQHMSFARLLPNLAAANHLKYTEGKDTRFHERVLPHPRPSQLLLTCPRATCGATKNCAKCLLHYKTAFKPVKCPSCRSSPSSAKWCCPCGHLWHHCPQHRAPGFAAGSGKRSSRAGVRKAAPKPLGHIQDPRALGAMRADFAAADLQAAWGCPMLFGPVAAILAAQAPCDSSNIIGHPIPRPRKMRKTAQPKGSSTSTKLSSCKNPPVDIQLDDSLHLFAPACPPLPSVVCNQGNHASDSSSTPLQHNKTASSALN